MHKKLFDKSLVLTKTALLISGIKISKTKWNPYIETFLNIWLYTINFACLYWVIFGEIYWVVDGINIGRNFVELSLTSPCITISFLGTVKSIFIYLNRDKVAKIVDKLREIHPESGEDFEKNDPEDAKDTEIVQDDYLERYNDKYLDVESKIVKDSVKFLKSFVMVLSSISSTVFVVFCFTPLLTRSYAYFVEGEVEIKYPYSVKYFFDVYKTSFWQFEYFLQVWATVVVCVNIFAADTFFYSFCTYTSMQFRLLGCRFERIVSASRSETKESLKRGVKRHQELIDLVNQAELVFSKSLLFNIVSSSLLICLSAFNVTVAEDGQIKFAFATFLLMSLSQISILCFFGDMLMKSSTEVSSAIYKCTWYHAEENVKKSILMIMIRAQKPCKLTAARFVDLNLGAFTTILSRSWSYFALLKTIYN